MKWILLVCVLTSTCLLSPRPDVMGQEDSTPSRWKFEATRWFFPALATDTSSERYAFAELVKPDSGEAQVRLHVKSARSDKTLWTSEVSADSVRQIVFGRDRNEVVGTCHRSGKSLLVVFRENSKPEVFPGEQEFIRDIHLSEGKKSALLSLAAEEVLHVSLESGEILADYAWKDGVVAGVTWTSDQRQAVAVGHFGGIRILDKKLKLVRQLRKETESMHVSDIAVIPGTTHLVITRWSGGFQVVDCESGDVVHDSKFNGMSISDVAVHPSGKYFALASSSFHDTLDNNDKAVRLIESGTWKELCVLRDHRAPVFAAGFSGGEDELLISLCRNGSVWVRELESLVD